MSLNYTTRLNFEAVRDLDKIIRRVRDAIETRAKESASGTEATKDDLADAARELGLNEFVN